MNGRALSLSTSNQCLAASPLQMEPLPALGFLGGLRSLAAELVRAGAWSEAETVYRELTNLAPDDLQGWLGRWECCQCLGHRVLADLLLTEALELHPEWSPILNRRVEAESMVVAQAV